MAPFGIKAVTGAVESRLFLSSPEVTLPPTSPYLAAKRNLIARASGEEAGKRMKTKEYATKVVGDVLGGADGLIYPGLWASMVRYVTTCVPSSWFKDLLLKRTGLNAISKQPKATADGGQRDTQATKQRSTDLVRQRALMFPYLPVYVPVSLGNHTPHSRTIAQTQLPYSAEHG